MYTFMQEGIREEHFSSMEGSNAAHMPLDIEGGIVEFAKESELIDPEDDFQRLTPQQQEDEILSHQKAVRSFISSQLYTEEDRNSFDDLTQETMLRGLQSRHQAKSIRKLKRWLYRIARYYIYDKHRKETIRGKGHSQSIDSPGVNAQGEPMPALEIPTGGEDAQIKKLDIARLKEFIELVPQEFREPLLLYHFDGLSVEEIVLKLGRNQNTIKAQLFRGREALKEIMKKSAVRKSMARRIAP